MKRPPIKGPRHGWVVVDVDGSILWGLTFQRLRRALEFRGYPRRSVVKLVVVEPKPRKRKARRGRR